MREQGSEERGGFFGLTSEGADIFDGLELDGEVGGLELRQQVRQIAFVDDAQADEGVSRAYGGAGQSGFGADALEFDDGGEGLAVEREVEAGGSAVVAVGDVGDDDAVAFEE